MSEQNLLTKEGYEKLVKELDNLKNVERPALRIQLQEARAQGDLSENADYDAAKKQQGELESRISEIEAILNNYKIIDNKTGTNSVKVGVYVTLLKLNTNTEVTYKIVGSTEANPAEGKISNECALAAAILNKKVGDECNVHCAKPYSVKILDISLKG